MKMPNCQLNITKLIFSKQKEKNKKLLREIGIIKPLEVLKHDGVSEMEEAFEGGQGGPFVPNLYLIKPCFWPQAYNSILKVQIAIFSPFGNVQFLFKQQR